MAVVAQTILDDALDLVEMTGSGFAVAARTKRWANQALSNIHYRLADGDNDWFSNTVDITISAGTAEYGLPNGTLYSSAPQFYKARGVWLKYNDYIYPLPKWHMQERHGWNANGPETGGTVQLDYIKVFQEINPSGNWNVLTVDTQYPPGWEDYAVCFVARRLAIRDENYERAAELKSERDSALMQVLQSLGPRDVGMPDRVQDVTNRWGMNRYDDAGLEQYYYRIKGDKLAIGSTGIIR